MEEAQLNQTFAALADPTRRAILIHLAREDATVNVLARPFPMTLQAVSRHLKVLEGAGLITRGRDAQFRPCALREAPLQEASGWMEHVRETRRQGMNLQDVQDLSDGPQDERPDEPAGSVPTGSAFAAHDDWAR